MNPMMQSVIVFSICYVLIMTEKVNKTLVALLGGFTVIALDIISYDTAIQYIDMEVVFLLMGMMMIVYVTAQTNVFQWIAIKSAKLVKGDPVKVLWMYGFITAIISAFLDNVTTVVLIVPITLMFTSLLKIDPFPYLFVEVFSSNIGGTATLIGDPPNIMIGTYFHIGFMDFMQELTPCLIVSMLVFLTLITFIFRKKLTASEEDKIKLNNINDTLIIQDKMKLYKCLAVLGIVIAFFLLHSLINVRPAIIAMLGAVAIVIITGEDTRKVLEKVEWEAIFFFVGLFMLVGALTETKFIEILGVETLKLTKGNVGGTTSLILFMSAVLSSVIDNVPYVATMLPLVKQVSASIPAIAVKAAVDNPLIWALSLGACLGGNGTIIGASANVVTFGMVKEHGIKVSFFKFLIYGYPLMLVTILISYVALYLQHIRFY